MASSLFLPLRSNAGWFTSEDTTEALDRRLKMLVVLYDKVILQDGRYDLTFWQDGQHLDMRLYAHQIPVDHRTLRYGRSGEPSSLAFQPPGSSSFVPVLSGPISSWQSVDFRPILERAGVLGEEYVELSDGDLNESAIDREKKRALEINVEEPSGDLVAVIQRRKALEALFIDAATARVLKQPFSCDSTVQDLVDVGIRDTLQHLRPDYRPSVYAQWTTLDLPDFTAATWSEIHGIRQSAAGRDLRRIIEKVSSRVAAAAGGGADGAEIAQIIRSEFVSESAREVAGLSSTARRLGIGIALTIGLNFVTLPLSASIAIAAAQEIIPALLSHRQWVALLRWKSKSETDAPLRAARE
jgi:hypothetical protein